VLLAMDLAEHRRKGLLGFAPPPAISRHYRNFAGPITRSIRG
jgi:hypothetical protein